jgi:hypothetical protein
LAKTPELNSADQIDGSDHRCAKLSKECKTSDVFYVPGEHDKKYSEADVQKIAAYLQTLR